MKPTLTPPIGYPIKIKAPPRGYRKTGRLWIDPYDPENDDVDGLLPDEVPSGSWTVGDYDDPHGDDFEIAFVGEMPDDVLVAAIDALQARYGTIELTSIYRNDAGWEVGWGVPVYEPANQQPIEPKSPPQTNQQPQTTKQQEKTMTSENEPKGVLDAMKTGAVDGAATGVMNALAMHIVNSRPGWATAASVIPERYREDLFGAILSIALVGSGALRFLPESVAWAEKLALRAVRGSVSGLSAKVAVPITEALMGARRELEKKGFPIPTTPTTEN